MKTGRYFTIRLINHAKMPTKYTKYKVYQKKSN